MKPADHWEVLERLFRRASFTSRAYAIATVDAEGAPHVTPIGSLILTGPGRGFFFEDLTSQLSMNLDRDPRLCVLAVDSGLLFWLKALFRGRFSRPPAVRLRGRVTGPARDATQAERGLWLRRVRHVRFLRGHDLLWGGMGQARDVILDEVEPVNVGPLTAGLWAEPHA
jgi:hypothetical protein